MGTLSLALALVLCVPVVASAATRYMSTTGTDAGSCSTSTSPCRTIGYAYNAAAAGDVVQVAAGSYGSQSVTGTKAAPGVVFDLDPSARFTNVGVNATWVEFRNGVIDDYGWWSGAVPSNVTMRNVTAKTLSMNGGSNISIIGGSIGGHVAPSGMPTGIFVYGWRAPLSNVTFDGVDIHDISHATASDHFEAIRIDGDVSGISIRNSKFRNITANSSMIFLSDINGGADPRNLTLENNFFAAAASGPGGGAYFAIDMNAVVGTCQNYAFRYNSFAGTPANLACTTKSNVSWIGNVAPKAPGCPGNTFRNNVWQSDTSSSLCGSGDKWVNGPAYSSSNLGFVNAGAGELHLTSTSPARDAGDTSSFPADDIDCASRISVPDAGADEYGISSSCGGTPPPPADTTAPDTTITSTPASSTESTSASFSFTATESGSTFACRIDGGTWTACTSPKAYSSLAVGSHTFEVRATDAAGNADASPASRTWSVTAPAPVPEPTPDTTAPDTTISSGPASSTESTSASFAFSAAVSGSTFACRIDGGPWEACTSPKSYSAIAVGSHAFEVRATDAAGNTDASPAGWNWAVTTAPAPSAMLLGNQSLESQVEYNPLGEAQAYRFTAVASGTMRTVRMYVDATNTAQTLVVGLYSNNSRNHPRKLLASTRVAAVSGQWNTLTLPGTSVSAGRIYWFAVLGTGSGTLRYRDRANAGVSETSLSRSLTSLPASWSTGSTYPFAAASIWGS